jgi:hypothetical protein
MAGLACLALNTRRASHFAHLLFNQYLSELLDIDMPPSPEASLSIRAIAIAYKFDLRL